MTPLYLADLHKGDRVKFDEGGRMGAQQLHQWTVEAVHADGVTLINERRKFLVLDANARTDFTG